MKAKEVLATIRSHCENLVDENIENDNEYIRFIIEQQMLSVLNLIEHLEDSLNGNDEMESTEVGFDDSDLVNLK